MRLRAATPSEAADRDRLNHETWGEGLSVEAHMAREKRLRGAWWPREALTTWLWEDEGALASCETYRAEVAVRGEPGLVWSIASVFTEPALRGRGHASAMLEALAAQQARLPGAQALVLFSDVSPTIYARIGFVARPAWDRVLPALPGDPDEGVMGLCEAQLGSVCRAPSGVGFSLPPTPAMLDWQIHHARVEAEIRGSRRAAYCGARVGDEIIVWQERDHQLLVLWIDAPTAGEALLRAAQRTAHAIGLVAVRAWETPGWPAGLGERVPRKGAVPMLMPLSPDADPAEWTDIPRGVWV